MPATSLAHQKYSHLNVKDLGKLVSQNMVTGLEHNANDSTFCESCVIGKATKGSPPQASTSRATRAGELFHSDLCGPLEASRSGFRYIMTFTDDFSRYSFVFLLKFKTETFNSFARLDALMYNQFGRHIRFLRSDNGTEYANSKFLEYCQVYGIQQQFTTPYASNQNGVAERLNLTLLDGIRTLLHASHQNLTILYVNGPPIY